MKKICLLVLTFLSAILLQAQITQISIGQTNAAEIFYDVKYDSTDGGTINVGTITTNGDEDCFLVKMNSSQQIVWQKSIPNTGQDYLYKVRICANGDYIASGAIVQNGISRGFVCRVSNATGNLIWSTTSLGTGSPNGDVFNDLIETADHNIALVGTTNNAAGVSNGIVVLLNSAGQEIWTSIFDYAIQTAQLQTVNQLANGSLLITGQYFTYGSSFFGYYVTLIAELNEKTASVLSQNTYSLNIPDPNPLSESTLTTLVGSLCYVINGTPVLGLIGSEGCCSVDNIQGVYMYDTTTKAITGNLYYHTGYNDNAECIPFPLSANDYIITQAFTNDTGMFVSRISNGNIVYDRQIHSSVNIVWGIDVNKNDLDLNGVTQDAPTNAYAMFSSTDFPISTSGCNISNANSLQIVPNTPVISPDATPFINATGSMTPLTIGVSNTSNTVSSLCLTMPVVLKNFQGSIINQSAELSWTTFDEVNTAFDVIQRSYDGSDFTTVGSLPAKGSLQQNQYQFADYPSFSNPTVFYRLKLIDKDGKYTYSNTLAFPLGKQTPGSVKLFPNPATNYVQLTYISTKYETTTIKVTDISGKTVLTQTASTTPGTNAVTLNFQNKLVSGTYIIQFVVNGQNQVNKVVVN